MDEKIIATAFIPWMKKAIAMHNPHNKTYLFVHLIWAVKYRDQLLTKPVRTKLFEHMLENARAKNIHIIAVNGVEDHIHCLLQLHPTQNVSAVVQLIKGNAAFWLNQHKLTDEDFKWQDGYAAYSVSPSMTYKVIKYIEKQEEHHRQKSLDDEMNVLETMGISKLSPDESGG